MRLYLELTDCEYELNIRSARLILRQHLEAFGFFTYPEHKVFWGLIEKPEAEGDEVEQFFLAVKLFNAIKMGRSRKAD